MKLLEFTIVKTYIPYSRENYITFINKKAPREEAI